MRQLSTQAVVRAFGLAFAVVAVGRVQPRWQGSCCRRRPRRHPAVGRTLAAVNRLRPDFHRPVDALTPGSEGERRPPETVAARYYP